MTASPSESTVSEAADALEEFADRVAAAVGGRAEVAHGTVKVRVAPSAWKEALTVTSGDLGLVFLSWLSATDWTNEVAVGDEPDEPVEERYELLCAVSDLSDGNLAIISTDLDHDSPSIPSVADVYPGANWHEREAAEMFGIDFVGHPDLTKLYLPDSFEGYPLRKDFPLLSREVKPWPGKVDVEDMPENGGGPSTENPGA
ncbi:MAG: NADH-quinone oxidoreductase subunit C [Acidimicrobiia bacterium]|nr:NADH-quinone oxidoreductase subunit C [Acidimicrobiia bacterium]MYF84468.1 NADH-quinone oxidoreductase subunit C [Acidimicrobiia bacterium]